MRRAWINADFIRAIKSPTDLRVLLAIAAHAREDGTGAYPPANVIRDLAGLESTRSVRRCVSRLIAAGFLVAPNRKGGHDSTRYRIPFERVPGLAKSPQGGPKNTALPGPHESSLEEPILNYRRSMQRGPHGSNKQPLEQSNSGGSPEPPRPPDGSLRVPSPPSTRLTNSEARESFPPLHRSGGAIDLQVESAAATRSQTGTSVDSVRVEVTSTEMVLRREAERQGIAKIRELLLGGNVVKSMPGAA